jgi:hypothetical protein
MPPQQGQAASSGEAPWPPPLSQPHPSEAHTRPSDRCRHGDAAIARGLSYAPYADLVWFETSTPDLAEAEGFATAIHERFPGKLLAYNCSPSFNWKRHLTARQIAAFPA